MAFGLLVALNKLGKNMAGVEVKPLKKVNKPYKIRREGSFLLVGLNEEQAMKMLLMFLSVAILSGCGGGFVTHMNKDSVSIQWDGLTSDLESVTTQAQEKCAVFGRKAVFVVDDGVYSFGRRLTNFKCVASQKKIIGKTLNDYR